MRAAVLDNGEFRIDNLPDPVPRAGQMLVAPRLNGICGSDLHLRAEMKRVAALASDEEQAAFPALVPGHEFSAVVIEVGPGTDTPFKPGDRIVPIPFARAGDGAETIGLSPLYSGGLAELSVVIADRCFRIPNGMPLDLAALTEPLSVGLHAANLADRNRGPNLIIGCGPVGLAVLLALRTQGRGPILAADFSPERRRLAEMLGADLIVDPADSSPYEHWSELRFAPEPTSPLLERGFSGRPRGLNIFECVGAPGLIDQVIGHAPRHSHIIVVGVCPHVDHYTPVEAITRELTLEHSFAYRPEEFVATLRMIDDRAEPVAQLITSRRPLAGTAEAFDALASSPAEVKVLIDPTR